MTGGIGGMEVSLDLPAEEEEGWVGVVESRNKEISLGSLEEGREEESREDSGRVEDSGVMPKVVSNFLRTLRKTDLSVDHSNGQVREGLDDDLP